MPMFSIFLFLQIRCGIVKIVLPNSLLNSNKTRNFNMIRKFIGATLID